MQGKTSTANRRFGRQVTLRIEPDLYQELASRAYEMGNRNPGMSVTVSDVIRAILTDAIRASTPRSPVPSDPALLEPMERYRAMGRGELDPATVKAKRRDT
jgi:hypothetical protein